MIALRGKDSDYATMRTNSSLEMSIAVRTRNLATAGTRWRIAPQYCLLYRPPGLTNITQSTQIALHTTCAVAAREHLLPGSACVGEKLITCVLAAFVSMRLLRFPPLC
jgi:hypothetical protein